MSRVRHPDRTSAVVARTPDMSNSRDQENLVHAIHGMATRRMVSFSDQAEAGHVLASMSVVHDDVVLRQQSSTELCLSFDMTKAFAKLAEAALCQEAPAKGRLVADLRDSLYEMEHKIPSVVRVAQACQQAYRAGRAPYVSMTSDTRQA